MDWNAIVTNWAAIANAVGSIATAIGVFFAWWQIRQAKKQAQSQFEDELVREYRNIVRQIPTKALLGERLNDKEYQQALDELYHYIDLTNEQIFLRQQKRVSKATWDNWCEGISSNLSRPTFKRAWEDIKKRSPGNFQELRQLEDKNYSIDPLQLRKNKLQPRKNKQK